MDIAWSSKTYFSYYAMAYLVGLISMIMFARLYSKASVVLTYNDSAEQIAQERGLEVSGQRKVYLPNHTSYRVQGQAGLYLDWR